MIDIVTNNVRQIGTPADEGRVYISEKAYKRIKTEGFKDKEVFVLMGHTESSGGRYATFVEAAIAVYDMEFDKNAPLWTNKVWSRVFAEIKKSYEELIIVGWAFRQEDFPAEPTPMLENIHREHFGGAHQLMFLLNRTEQEENFFIKKNNHLKKKTGFFVYYRMNEHCDSADSYNETYTCNKTCSYSNANNNNKIDMTKLEKTMMSEVNGKFTADYLWDEKGIVSFLKVDKGLAEEKNGVKLMKEIQNLKEEIEEANKKNVFGTKMRSVIYEANEEGIRDIVNQQFEFAKTICDGGLVPIIEPEVDIHSEQKELCEKILKDEIIRKLKEWNPADKIMFKFTIPTVANHYLDLYDYDCVVRIVALSGGYEIDEACELLTKNNRMIASFSRALLQDLNAHQTQEEFDTALNNAIVKIYNASID